jgi:sugar phosphate isomerase/epimerase
MMKILQGTISYPEVKWGKAEDRAAKNTPLIKFVDDLVKVGADGIELWGRHLDNLPPAGADDLAAKIARSGQKVPVLAAYWDFSSSDDAVKASLVDAERFLATKDLFQAKKIRVFTGAPGSATATEENWKRAVKGMRRLARMYDGTGVTFVVETHPDQLPDTVATALRLMKELEEPSILLNYQAIGEGVSAELDVLYQWVAHAHVSFARDWHKTAESTVRELARRGYAGTVTVEFCTDSLPPEGVKFDRAKALAGMKRDVALLKKLAK